MHIKYGKYMQKDSAYFINAVLNAGSENEHLKLAKLKNDSLIKQCNTSSKHFRVTVGPKSLRC